MSGTWNKMRRGLVLSWQMSEERQGLGAAESAPATQTQGVQSPWAGEAVTPEVPLEETSPTSW